MATEIMQTIGAVTLNSSETIYRNLASFPGQVFTTPPLMPMDREVRWARKDIVRAARHVERYSEHIRGGIDRKADMVTGPALRVHARPDWETLGIADWKTMKPFAQALERAFNNWAYDERLLQDAEGHYDFGGLMWLAFRHITGPDGECCGIIHYEEERARAYGTRWATFVQIVDPDRLETPPELTDDPRIVDGKGLDRWGRAIAYFFRKYEPGTAWAPTGRTHELVPRESKTGRPIGFHWYVKTRAGQLRGVSTLVTILRQSGMLDKFDDAYLSAAVINQVLATWIESEGTVKQVANQLAPAGEGVLTGGWDLFNQKLDYYAKTTMRVGGARIPVMPPGDKVNMTAVNRAIDDPSYFRNGFLRMFASAVGVSFEQLSQNFSDANYSAARAAILETWRGIEKMRVWFGRHVASLVYSAVIEEAIIKGFVPLPAGAPDFHENRAAYTRCTWTGPGMMEIDPQKAAVANEKDLAMRVTSREEIVARRGGYYLDVFDQIEQEYFEAEERDINLDPMVPGLAAEEEAPETPEEGKPAKSKGKGSSVKDGDGDGQLQE